MEMLKRSFDDFEKRQEEEGVPVECLLPILVVVGIHPDKRDLEDALMELVDLDLQEVSEVNLSHGNLVAREFLTGPREVLGRLVTSSMLQDNLDFEQVCQVAARFLDEGDERQVGDR